MARNTTMSGRHPLAGSGIALLLASVIAGALWDQLGHSGTFMAGAVFAGLAMLGFAARKPLC